MCPRTRSVGGGSGSALSDRRHSFQVLAIGSAAAIYATMVLGGAVKATGAGLACPDWPLCHGTAIPDLGDPLIVLEWIHRALAAAASLFIVATMLATYLWFRKERLHVFFGSMAVVALAAQVTLGMLTITSSLDPVVVTSHLALATATFAFALLLAFLSVLRAGAAGAPPVAPP